MSSISPQEIKKEFFKSKMGIAGITILINSDCNIINYNNVIIPVETFQEWNNPGSWIAYPKTAIPIWVNFLSLEKTSRTQNLNRIQVFEKASNGEINLSSYQFDLNFDYDQFPNDFIYSYSSEYSDSPLLQMSVIRPDGIKLELISTSLPYSDLKVIHEDRIFSTDVMIKKKLSLQSDKFDFKIKKLSAENIIFSKTTSNEPLKGNYVFFIDLYEIGNQ